MPKESELENREQREEPQAEPAAEENADPARRSVYTTNLKSSTLMTRLETEIPEEILAFARQMNEDLWMEEPGADELPRMNRPDAPQEAEQPKEQADPMKLFRARFLASPQAVIDQMKDRYIVEECGLSDEEIQEYVDQALPGFQRPDPETKQRLRKQKEELSAKLYEQLLYYNVMIGMENGLPRAVQALCPLGDYSEQAIKDTLNFYHAFRNGSEVTPAGKKETLARQLYRVGKIDLSKLDPADPQSLIDNLSDVLTVMHVGWEMQRYIPQIKAFGPAFMEDPRVRLFLQKAAAMYDLAPVLGNTLQMMTASVYPELGPEAFRYYQPNREITIPDSDYGGAKMITTTVKEVYGNGSYEVPFTDASVDASAGVFAMKAANQQEYAAQTPFLQKDTPMKERLQGYFTEEKDQFKVRQYWNVNQPTTAVYRSEDGGNISTADVRMNAAAIKAVRTYLNPETGEYGKAGLVRDFLANPLKVFDQLKNGYTVDQRGMSDKAIDTFIKDTMPGYTRPTPEEKTRYAAYQAEISRRLYATILQREIFAACAGGVLDRKWQGFFSHGDMSKAAIDDAVAFARAFANGSKATDGEKKELLAKKLEKFAAIDLSALDPTDPQAIMEHLDEIMTVAAVGEEMEKILFSIREFGPAYMEDPRVRAFLEKADVMYELSGLYGSVTSMMCSSIFPELGLTPVFHYDVDKKITVTDPQSREKVETEVVTAYSNGMYPVPVNDASVDGSARSYVVKCSFCAQMQSPLMDRSKPMLERVRDYIYDPEHDYFKFKQQFTPKEEFAEGTAPEKKYMPEKAYMKAANQENQKKINHLMFPVSGGYSPAVFSPVTAGDVLRLYKLDKNGYYAAAFPEAARPDWQGLNEAQILDILSTKDQYIYFQPGAKEPMVFQDGILKLQTHKVADPEHPGKTRYETTPVRFVFGSEGYRRMYGPMGEVEALRLAKEKEIHDLDNLLRDQRRVEEVAQGIFGSDTSDRGSEQYRSYAQEAVNHMWELDGSGSFAYPAPNGKLTESEITVLTILSIARPDVNGRKIERDDADAGVMYGYGMAVNDLYNLRSATPTNHYADWVFDGRKALAPILAEYYRDGNLQGLAETVAKGLRVMAISSANLTDINAETLSQLLPARQLTELLQHHPALLTAARQYAADNGIGDFDKQYTRCRSSAALYDSMLRSYEAKRRLLAYETGELRSDDGHLLRPTAEERTALELDAAKAALFSQDAIRYDSVAETLLPAEQQAWLTQETQNTAMLSAQQDKENQEEMLAAAAEGRMPRQPKKIDYIGELGSRRMLMCKDLPVSPLVELTTLHENGMKALEAVLEGLGETGATVDADVVTESLIRNGLLPQSGKPDAAFDYDQAIRHFQLNRAQFFTAAYKQDFETKYGHIAQEAGLDYETIRDLAAVHKITPEEYIKRIALELEMSVEKYEKTDSGIGALEKLVEELPEVLPTGNQEIKALAEKLCAAVKDLNQFSVTHQNDLYSAYQAGDLLTRLYLKIYAFGEASLRFKMEKNRNLQSVDYVEMEQTVQRHLHAAKALQSNVVRNMPRAIDENLNAYKAQYQEYLHSSAENAKANYNTLMADIRTYQQNLKAIFGTEARKTGEPALDEVADTCGSDSRYTLPNGFTEEAAEMLVRTALLSPDSVQRYADPDAGTKIEKLNYLTGHGLNDIAKARANTNDIMGQSIRAARMEVKKALDSYRLNGDPEALGRIIGQNLRFTVNPAIDGNNTHSTLRYVEMKSNVALLGLLEKNPDLLQASARYGLTAKTLRCLQAQKTLETIFERNAAALRDLYSAEPTSAAKMKGQLLDMLAGEVALKLVVNEQNRLGDALAQGNMKDMMLPMVEDPVTKRRGYPSTNTSRARLFFQTSEDFDRLADGVGPLRKAIEESDTFRRLLRDVNNGVKLSRLVELKERMKTAVDTLTGEFLKTPAKELPPVSQRVRANSFSAPSSSMKL